jgi:XapX domain-containing protein
MVKMIVGIILGLLIGAACRWFEIPLPAPTKLLGALLVLAVTLGYAATDKLIATRFTAKRPIAVAETNALTE